MQRISEGVISVYGRCNTLFDLKLESAAWLEEPLMKVKNEKLDMANNKYMTIPTRPLYSTCTSVLRTQQYRYGYSTGRVKQIRLLGGAT